MEQTHIKVDIGDGPQVESQLYENSNNAGDIEKKPRPVHVFEIQMKSLLERALIAIPIITIL